VFNTCYSAIKSKPLSIFCLQESHIDDQNGGKLKLMWRGKSVISKGTSNSRGCITLVGEQWDVVEVHEAVDGHMVCAALKCEQVSILVVNIYALNDHNVAFFENFFEITNKYQDYLVAVAGDFNIVLSEKLNSVNRKSNLNKGISRRLVKDNMRVLNMVDARVELLPAFKFTGKLVKNKDFTGKW
jgi:hypothetical protein